MTHAHVAEDQHSTGATYIKIAVVLFILTALEVLLYEVCYGESLPAMASLGGSLAPYFVELLLLLSAFKFWFVAMFYMHLKFDLKPLTWLFSFSLLIAVLITIGLIALFHYNRTLWWAGGTPW
ncbi:MAG TPA: cytochrome C oxidase subunit IV family protein [Gemmatimonadales bacterium]|nr:cytochrome C oxidase subunit IV family protein [Gemmatimonadales bacterium]